MITVGTLFRSQTRAYALGIAALAAFQGSLYEIDVLTGRSLDAIHGGDVSRAKQFVFALFVLATVAFFARVASRHFLFNAGRDVEYFLRERLLKRLHELGRAFYARHGAGDIMSRATSDVMQVRMLYGFGVLNLANVVLAFVSALTVMMRISVRLTLSSLVIFPLVVFSGRFASRFMFLRNRQNQEALGALSDVIQSTLSGIRVVRSFGVEDAFAARFARANERYLAANLALARIRGAMGPMLGAAGSIGVLIFFWYGSSLLQRGAFSRGDFVAFSSALARMTWPMISVGFAIAILQRGRAGLARLQEVYQAHAEVTSTNAVAELPNADIEVKNLSFAYGERTILRDVSFRIPSGRTVALMGLTGAGKTTLALLLARLLPAPRGTIFVGGVDVSDVPLPTLRQTIAYAEQEAFLFSTTVGQNIAFSSSEELDDAVVRRAAERAAVADDIARFPSEFDTVVGERGVQLSGGQKQRIALARALLRNAKVLILDDPLSAVDAGTERRILDTLREETRRASLLLISHRVAAASLADEILVLDAGTIVEKGTHEELLRANGLYATFAEEQRLAQELERLAEVKVEPAAPVVRVSP